MRKKSRLTRDSDRRGDRARKERNAFYVAKHRAARAAALREEVEDIEEDVVPYEHKGGEVGDSIRLSTVSSGGNGVTSQVQSLWSTVNGEPLKAKKK